LIREGGNDVVTPDGSVAYVWSTMVEKKERERERARAPSKKE